MIRIVFFGLIILYTGCAKISYVTSQSIEQIKLVTSGENIDDLIQSKEIDPLVKERLQEIKSYKNFFSQYLNEDVGEIYNNVIFLNREHVSQLVISSSWSEIKPLEECFIIVGCFPYLGFFNLSDAKKYHNEMLNKGYSSHIRPVNAYSTLGNFNDRVLSSFFNYSKKGLAHLIFHELVHSAIFFKNGVNFNENLANFFADELVFAYFKESKEKVEAHKKRQIISKKINLIITNKTKNINKALNEVTKGDKKKIMKTLIKEHFGKGFTNLLSRLCEDFKIKKEVCLSYQKDWTPSKLAALGTYNKLQEEINTYYQSNFSDIASFYKFLKGEYLKGTNSEDIINIIKKHQ